MPENLARLQGHLAQVRRAAGDGHAAEVPQRPRGRRVGRGGSRCHLVFVQTHADQDADIRDDWRQVLVRELAGPQKDSLSCRKWQRDSPHLPKAAQRLLPTNGDCPNFSLLPIIFLIDSLRALADAQAGLQPRGDFADLLDLLTRQMAGAAGNRIRRANFLDLVADTLDSCRARHRRGAAERQDVAAGHRRATRAAGAGSSPANMQAELLANRRQWENRLLGQAASRWGFSPFALVLRVYQGLGGICLRGVALSRPHAGPNGPLGCARGRARPGGGARRLGRPIAASTGRQPAAGTRPNSQGRADRRGLRRRGRPWIAAGPLG